MKYYETCGLCSLWNQKIDRNVCLGGTTGLVHQSEIC